MRGKLISGLGLVTAAVACVAVCAGFARVDARAALGATQLPYRLGPLVPVSGGAPYPANCNAVWIPPDGRGGRTQGQFLSQRPSRCTRWVPDAWSHAHVVPRPPRARSPETKEILRVELAGLEPATS